MNQFQMKKIFFFKCCWQAFDDLIKSENFLCTVVVLLRFLDIQTERMLNTYFYFVMVTKGAIVSRKGF